MIKKCKPRKYIFIMCILLLFSAKGVAARTDASRFRKWGQATTISDKNKPWYIKFTHSLRESTINEDNVFIEDEDGNILETDISLSNDRRTIKISPSKAYENLKSYRIYLNDGIENEEKAALSYPIYYDFSIQLEENKTSIKEVNSIVNYLFASVSVKTSSNIYKVYVDGVEAKYKGNDEYNVNLLDKKYGHRVKIETYDDQGELVDEIEYKISE